MKNFNLKKTITDGEFKIFPTKINGQKGYVLKKRTNFLFWKVWVPVINQFGIISCLESDKEYLEIIVEQLKTCLTTIDVLELKTYLTIKNNNR